MTVVSRREVPSPVVAVARPDIVPVEDVGDAAGCSFGPRIGKAHGPDGC